MRILLRYIMTNIFKYSYNTLLIKTYHIAGTLVNLKNIIKYLYNLN